MFNHKHFEDADGSFTIRFPMGILWNIQDFIKIMTKHANQILVDDKFCEDKNV